MNSEQETLEVIDICFNQIEDITQQPDFDPSIEYWRMCIGNPGYEVSSFGNVRKAAQKIYVCSEDGNETLIETKPPKSVNIYKANVQGYYMVTIGLPNHRKQIGVHRLVAMNFIKKPFKEKGVVRHKDGNKLNNHVENLEYVTYQSNGLKAIDSVTRITTAVKCLTTHQYFSSIQAASIYFNIPYVHLQRYLQRKTSDVPDYWVYDYDFIMVPKDEVRKAMKTDKYVDIDTLGKPIITLSKYDKD